MTESHDASVAVIAANSAAANRKLLLLNNFIVGYCFILSFRYLVGPVAETSCIRFWWTGFRFGLGAAFRAASRLCGSNLRMGSYNVVPPLFGRRLRGLIEKKTAERIRAGTAPLSMS